MGDGRIKSRAERGSFRAFTGIDGDFGPKWGCNDINHTKELVENSLFCFVSRELMEG